MGKSEGNSLWLDPEMTSPYDFYQYWVNVDDADVEKLLRLYTFLPMERIAELTSVEGAALRDAKQVLAMEVTTLTHGAEAAAEAVAASRALFGAATSVLMMPPSRPRRSRQAISQPARSQSPRHSFAPGFAHRAVKHAASPSKAVSRSTTPRSTMSISHSCNPVALPSSASARNATCGSWWSDGKRF